MQSELSRHNIGYDYVLIPFHRMELEHVVISRDAKIYCDKILDKLKTINL